LEPIYIEIKQQLLTQTAKQTFTPTQETNHLNRKIIILNIII
jgi:hypothetical protein